MYGSKCCTEDPFSLTILSIQYALGGRNPGAKVAEHAMFGRKGSAELLVQNGTENADMSSVKGL